MRKLNNGTILALTAVIIVLCGMLPNITAMVEDLLTDGKIYYQEMKTVQFFQDLNDTQKMYLLENGSTALVTEFRAKLEQDEIREVVEAALQPYVYMGYIKAKVSDFTMECEPVLYYSNKESNLSAIFWKINMELSDEWGQSISLYLDDATGKIWLISYKCAEPVFDKNMLNYNIQGIFLLYQSYMDWYNPDTYYEEGNEEYKHEYAIHYRSGDMIYGEFGIEFVISETGFRVWFE